MRFVERTRQAMLLFLMGLVALVAVALILFFLVAKPAAQQALPGGNSAAALIPASGPRDTYTDPNAGVVFLVPADRIPQTQAQRYGAPADTLLPDRWANNANADSEIGPSQDKASIPVPDRHILIDAVSAFLAQWETFTPPDLAQASVLPQAYTNRLTPLVVPGDLGDIAGRVDNVQGGGVCPASGCLVGSTFDSGDMWDSTNVRYYNGSSAYVTAYGDVTYHAVFGTSPLDGVTFQRSYGLLLNYVGGRWLVARVSAASNGQVS